MRYFPVFLDLRGRTALVVGGGAVGLRKVGALRDAGARVRVIAPALDHALRELALADRIEHRPKLYDSSDLEQVVLAIAATDDAQVNAQVARDANARNIPVNVVDTPALCSAILPAVVDRSPLIVAVSSGGTAPVLARRVRERIERLLEPRLGQLARVAGRLRQAVKHRIPDVDRRRRFWERFFDGPASVALLRGARREAWQWLRTSLNGDGAVAPRRGHVSLVGAGPGDPGLLTLHALRRLQDADIVFHDALVSDEILALARRDARLVSVGKRAGKHSAKQDEINALLLAAARAGQRVVRLKGGDPLVFGRGGEELEFLRAHAIDYDVVPGITAAIAAGAYAGIPLTHRQHARSLRLATAHCACGLDGIDWNAMRDPQETLAFYMGVDTLAALSDGLIAHGRDPATPAALIENASRPEQRAIYGTLASISMLAVEHAVRAPALLLVGSVVALGKDLHWFGRAPLGADTATPREPAPVSIPSFRTAGSDDPESTTRDRVSAHAAS